MDTDNKTDFTNDATLTMRLDTTSLRPQVPIDMADSNKIVGVSDATDSKDAMNLGQAMSNYWL